MDNWYGKKFIASYSGGKDSVFAVYKAIKAGFTPIELITTYNTEAGRSWFHGLTENIIRQVSDSLNIPVKLIKTVSEQYEENFEKALTDAKNRGAEVCVFGDIDIEDHINWCALRCKNTGLIPYFPLYKEDRKKAVYDFIEAGFSAIITIVDTSRLPASFLGYVLSRETADLIEKSGADICGENGEYHTFVFNGPIFAKKIDFSAETKLENDKYYMLNIV